MPTVRRARLAAASPNAVIDVRIPNPAQLLERIYSLPLGVQQTIYKELGAYLANRA